MTASFLLKQVATLLGWASKDSPGTDKPLLLHSHLSAPFHRALLQPIRRAAFPEPAVNSAGSVASVSAPPSPSGKSQSIPEPLFWKQPGARAGVRAAACTDLRLCSSLGCPDAPLSSAHLLRTLLSVHLPASRPLKSHTFRLLWHSSCLWFILCASTQYQINSALPLQTFSWFFIISSFPSSCLPPSCFNLILFPTHRKNSYGIPALLQEPLETPPAVHPGKGQPEAAAAPSWLWLPSCGHT